MVAGFDVFQEGVLITISNNSINKTKVSKVLANKKKQKPSISKKVLFNIFPKK